MRWSLRGVLCSSHPCTQAVPVISQARFLEKRGEVQELAKGGTIFSLRSKFVSICLFLFNDLLIITNKRRSVSLFSCRRISVLLRSERGRLSMSSFTSHPQQQHRPLQCDRPRPPLTGPGPASQQGPLSLDAKEEFFPHTTGEPQGSDDQALDKGSYRVRTAVWATCYSRHTTNAASSTSLPVSLPAALCRSDMHRWMAAFPNPSTPKQEEEVIYEDWGE